MKSKKKMNKLENLNSTREKLLAVALELFARQGYDGTSTKQICDEAGANPAAVTYHFQTKENLLNVILSEQLDDDFIGLTSILKEVHSVEEFKIRMRMFCETLVNLRIKNPDFHRLVLVEAPKNARAFATFKAGIDAFEKNMQAFLKDAQKKGFIAPDIELSIIGFVIVSLVSGPAVDPTLPRINPDFDLKDAKKRDIYFDRILRIVFHGLIREGIRA